MSTFVCVNLTFLLLLFHKEWDSIICDSTFSAVHLTFNITNIVIFNELERRHLFLSLLLGRQLVSISTCTFISNSLYHTRHTAYLSCCTTKSSYSISITRFKLTEARLALAAFVEGFWWLFPVMVISIFLLLTLNRPCSRLTLMVSSRHRQLLSCIMTSRLWLDGLKTTLRKMSKTV